jgi:hypothetical protein
MSNIDKRNRFSIDLPPDWQDYLAHTARIHRLTQGEVVQTLLANMHSCAGIEQALAARREEKVAARRSKASMTAAFKQLTPEQQRRALEALGAES